MKYIGMNRFQTVLFGIGLVFSLSACDGPASSGKKQVFSPGAVRAVKIVPADMELGLHQTRQLSVVLGDAAGNRLAAGQKSMETIADIKGRGARLVKWRSSHPLVVRVDAGGLATALSEGTAKITASSEGADGSIKIRVSGEPVLPMSVSPIRATVFSGASLQLTPVWRNNRPDEADGPIVWHSDRPSHAKVSENGRVTAIKPGQVIISARSKGATGQMSLTIRAAQTIFGLDFPGSAGVHKTMRFAFGKPLPAYPATYIWRAYPRQQLSYYTAFFWGNNGPFHSKNTYYGFHPYPDWDTASHHFWEIAAPPGGDFVSPVHVVYDRWYLQVAVCRYQGNKTVEEFYWDWPDQTKVIRHVGEKCPDPPSPGLMVGDAPWNPGNEVWDGVLRGFQFYDAALGPDDIEREIASPGSVVSPWYLNSDPVPDDIDDKSGTMHHPAWIGGERPALWKGTVTEEGIIQTQVPPR